MMTEEFEIDALDVIGQLLGWLDKGEKAALAIVIETWGSSPCPAGSLLAISDKTAFFGSVSGGCVENTVVTEAQDLIENQTFRVLEFGIANEDAWEVGLACGGQVRVFVTHISDAWRDVLEKLAAQRKDGIPAGLVIDIETGTPKLMGTKPADTSRLLDDATKFVAVFNPPLRLLIVGAVHIAQALASMAASAGMAVTVIDPRDAWASAERFPGIVIDRRWPGEAIAELKPDARTAVVSLSHDPKLDDPALKEALASDAFYIGALGSRRTHAKRHDRLAQQGIDEAAFARIDGPIGLDIGAVTPGEIAVSIMAEIVSRLRGGKS
ncbi:MAG: XdhC family protein [Proteobacteria bacterium]|nr:XdhC family protein [Pseudomonadota bacterium]MDA1023842.1 XdhC family protein [Pseudomonadota bacterium]